MSKRKSNKFSLTLLIDVEPKKTQKKTQKKENFKKLVEWNI